MSDINDKAALRDLRSDIANLEASLRVKREQVIAIAARLRDAGVPMSQIAHAAGVSDSYLSRRLIARGAPRRTSPGRVPS